MSGKLTWGHRVGNIAEGIGISALRAFSLVAPVPRTEDVGVDGLATLLEPDKQVVRARDSFWVQIKSTQSWGDDDCLEFQGDSLDWLRSLDMPYFFVSVKPKAACVEVFTFHSAYRQITGLRELVKGLKLRLGVGEMEFHEGCVTEYLGPPVLKARFEELAQRDLASRCWEIMKVHLETEQLNVSRRSAGIFRELAWTCDSAPTLGARITTGTSVPGPLPSIKLNPLVDVVQSLRPEIFAGLGTEEDWETLARIEELLVRNGVHERLPEMSLRTSMQIRNSAAAKNLAD